VLFSVLAVAIPSVLIGLGLYAYWDFLKVSEPILNLFKAFSKGHLTGICLSGYTIII